MLPPIAFATRCQPSSCLGRAIAPCLYVWCLLLPALGSRAAACDCLPHLLPACLHTCLHTQHTPTVPRRLLPPRIHQTHSERLRRSRSITPRRRLAATRCVACSSHMTTWCPPTMRARGCVGARDRATCVRASRVGAAALDLQQPLERLVADEADGVLGHHLHTRGLRCIIAATGGACVSGLYACAGAGA